MSRLAPPPQRDLPDAVHREIHVNLVRTSRAAPAARSTRRWVVPALALAGALATAAAVGLNLPETGRIVTAVPAGPAPTATADPTGTSSATPAAQSIDAGPLSSPVTDKIAASCLHGFPKGATVAEVHLARQTSVAGPVVLLTDSTGILHLCRDGSDITGPPLDAGSPLGDPQRPSPSQRRPVVQLTGFAGSGGGPSQTGSGVENTAWSYYRISPDVASLQVRLTVNGHTGPWFDTINANGYAFAYASEDHPSSQDDHVPDTTYEMHVDDRAYDATGHQLNIDHVTR